MASIAEIAYKSIIRDYTFTKLNDHSYFKIEENKNSLSIYYSATIFVSVAPGGAWYQIGGISYTSDEATLQISLRIKRQKIYRVDLFQEIDIIGLIERVTRVALKQIKHRHSRAWKKYYKDLKCRRS